MVIFEVKLEDIRKFENDFLVLFQEALIVSFPSYDSQKAVCHSSLEKLKKYIEERKAIVLGVKEKESLLGFIWFFPKENSYGRAVHINYFVIKSELRGKGLGKKLLNAVETYAKKHGILEMELLVTKGNENAVNFYKNESFEIDRLLMRKRLL